MFKTLYKLGCKIATEIWWPFWSSHRWKNSIKEDLPLAEEDTGIHTIADVLALDIRLYQKFKYTKDGVDQLFDAITPPPQNYQHYLDGQLKDDCDGYHSLLYHVLHGNGIECYLLTANSIGSGHCVLLFYLNGLWYVNDYRRIYAGNSTPEESINKYNANFPHLYNAKAVVYNGLIGYDYATGKFYATTLNKIKAIERHYYGKGNFNYFC